MEQGAPWSSEILPLDGRMALLRRWLQGQPEPWAEVRPAKVLALAVEGGSPPEKGGRKVRMSLKLPSGKLTMENHHFYWVNPLFLWPFSIANC